MKTINCFFCGSLHSVDNFVEYKGSCLKGSCRDHGTTYFLFENEPLIWEFYTINFTPIYNIFYNFSQQILYINHAIDLTYGYRLDMKIDNPGNRCILAPDNWKQKLPTLLTFL